MVRPHDRVSLPRGRGHIEVHATRPRRFVTVDTPVLFDGVDAGRRVNDALDDPIGSGTIADHAKGRTTACVVICDITRPVPNRELLRPIVDRLVQGGIQLEAITILVATGLHRPNLGNELESLIGDDWILKNVTIVNHDARRLDQHRDLGHTPGRGVPILIDRRFVDADVRIVTGLVEPHFMAGWSGGRKVVAPGIAHEVTIRTFHSARFMEHPAARACNLVDNPLHEEQLAITEALDGQVLAVNVVVDDERRILRCTFGDVRASHDAAVDFAARSTAVEVARTFSTVVTSAGGFPLDQTYYQTIKAMVTPLGIVEPGGDLIVVSDCTEGLGSPQFRHAQQRLVDHGPDAFISALLAKELADTDEWQTEKLIHALRHCNITLIAPGLDDRARALTGVRVTDDLDGAIRASTDHHRDPTVAVIPGGPYVVPSVSHGNMRSP
jgi:nickel-dependent lactate racemase